MLKIHFIHFINQLYFFEESVQLKIILIISNEYYFDMKS